MPSRSAMKRVPPVIRMASAGTLRTANICSGCNADIGPSGKPNLESMTVLTARMLLQTRAVKSPCSGAQWRFLVLPVRIELTTSPLPRECSTTELRQRRAGCELRRDAAANAAILAIRATAAQAAVGTRQASLSGPSVGLPSRCPASYLARHGRSSQAHAEGKPAAASRRGIAGEPQAPQGPGERARKRARDRPQGRPQGRRQVPRFRRNCRT